jgi:hypothetical protein
MSLETSRLRITGVNLVNGAYELQTERQTTMDNILFIPGLDYTPTDPDAKAYVSAVQVADNQPLESNVKRAINDLVVDLKAGDFWDKLGVAYLFAGARTYNGALVPLRGPAPTNTGFGQDDYHRLWGLKSDGTKWLDSNRANDIDGQDDSHNAIWLHTAQPRHISGNYLGSGTDSGSNQHGYSNNTNVLWRNRSATSSGLTVDSAVVNGVWGATRTGASGFSRRAGTAVSTNSVASQAPNNRNIYIFGRNDSTGIHDSISLGRLRWYSAGAAIALSTLETLLQTFFTKLRLLQPTTLNVFLVGGQSNAEGRNTLASLPTGLANPIPNVMMYHGTNIENYYFNHQGPLGNGSYWSYNPNQVQWGPYHVTLKQIADSIPNVVAVQVSAGGSVLDSVASPTASRGSWSDRFGSIPGGTPALLQALEQRVDALKAWATTNGVQLNFRGMFWHQGEADQQVGGSSVTNYESNWQDVVDYIRGFTRADLPIIYGTVSDQSTLFDATIKAAQLAVAAGDSNLYCRDNDGLAMIGGGDTTHFSAASAVTFGEWAAETWLQNYG